ncbi:MAG TPA: TolC family protein [Burkholderiales bacterium]|nr:TolC family protein [Burkholderiales bacterium]
MRTPVFNPIWSGSVWLAGAVLTLALAVFNLAHAQASSEVTTENRIPADLGALTLQRAEQLMLARNHDVQRARRAVEAAEAGVTSAGARPNPNLTLGVGSVNPSLGAGGGNLRDKTVDSSLRLDQVLERGDKRELRVAGAKSQEAAAGGDYQDAVRQALLALRQAYYDLLLAQDRLAIANDTLGLFDRSLDAADKRYRAGDIAASDVSRLRVDALRAANDARSAEADLRRARGALALLMDVDAADAIKAVSPWPDARDLPTDVDTEQVIGARADVRAAQARVEAASSARDLARAQRTRDVSVGVQYDHFPASAANPTGTGNTFGVSVSVPLFVNYGFEGEIRRAESDYGAAMDALARTRAQARSELQRARSDLRAAADRLQRYDTSLLVEARRSAESAEFAYRNGAIGVMDLLDARRTLRSIENDAAQAHGDFAKALAAWEAGRAAAPAQ